MRKAFDSLMNFYNNHSLFYKRLCVMNVALYSLVLIALLSIKQYQLFGFVIWFWGLSLASLAIELKRK